MAYKGKYKVRNYRKYKGDPTQVVFRSLWERQFMDWCDSNTSVIEWSSEEYIIPYKDPVAQKWRRYFPDFYCKIKETDGKVKSYLIEVKPAKQVAPPQKQQRKTKRYITEVQTYATNTAKWNAAEEFCRDRLWQFKIITEHELQIRQFSARPKRKKSY